MSRNALFKHLDEKHRFCRKWQQQSEAEEKTSPHACNGSHTNPCPAASPWQIQRISVVSKRSHALASKTTRLPHVNGFAALYEPDEHGCGFLTGDDQIDSFAVFWEQDKAAIAPPSPRYTFPRAASTRVVVVDYCPPFRLGWVHLSSAQTYLYRADTLILFANMHDKHQNHLPYTVTCVYAMSMPDVDHVRLRYHLINAIWYRSKK